MKVMINLTCTPLLGFDRFDHHCHFWGFFEFIFEMHFILYLQYVQLFHSLSVKLAKCR